MTKGHAKIVSVPDKSHAAIVRLLNDTSQAVPGALAQCLQCRRGLSNGHSFEKSRRQRKEKKNKKRKGENSGPLTICRFT